MQYLSQFFLMFTLVTSVAFTAKADEDWADFDAPFLYSATPSLGLSQSRPKVKLLWVQLNRPATYSLIKQQLEKSLQSNTDGLIQPQLQTIIAPVNPDSSENPFAIANHDFKTGDHLTNETAYGPIPTTSALDQKWFDDQVSQDLMPDVFMIGGHHVISEGWHNSPESKFLYMPTLLDTLSKSASARKVFDHVKLAILWGCNTMTNLEPHGIDGAYLDPNQIKADFSQSVLMEDKMLGLMGHNEVKTNSLEFYKQRLAREYGPSTTQYEYTRLKQDEKCIPGLNEPFKNCPITNLERILPDSYLYDGNHLYNEPYRMKQIFRNAYLVLGFSSASPSEEQRAKILSQVLSKATEEVNRELSEKNASKIDNILYSIIDDQTPKPLRIKLIESVRKFWTIETYQLNRQRPSGSITPALPELDRNGVFNVNVSVDTPLISPYEK